MTFHDENYPEDVTDDETYMLTERHAPVWDVSICLAEFGPHEDHDDCENIMWEMSYGADAAYDAYYDDSYNREAEENMLGRPLFPNEY